MPKYHKDVVQFSDEVFDAFFKFSFDHGHDKEDMVMSLLHSDDFEGELTPLNTINPYVLMRAIFYGYRKIPTPGEKLLEEIDEATERFNSLTQSEQKQRAARYIDGLNRAANIMGVRK